MRGRQILVEPRAGGGAAAALVVDGRLEDLLVDPAPGDAAPRPEAIYRAVAGRPMKGLGGVMVELGGGATGFLRGARLPAPGARLLVQVATWAEPGKAAPVTTRIRLKGRLAILTPEAPGVNISRAIEDGAAREALAAAAAATMAGAGAEPGLGLIVRSLAATADPAALAAEIAGLRARVEGLTAGGRSDPPGLLAAAPGAAGEAARDWPLAADEAVEVHPEALARAGIWETAAGLLRPEAALPGGAWMAIEPTRALVAVDVNTGGDASPAAAIAANVAAARELPRQLRLRGLGGQVVVDLAPLAKAERGRIEQALTAALRRDGVETTIAGWTPLGHLELNRKRARRPLAELPLR
ncbi:ribonuclease E/G [Amaricoccus sp.]|uniref:ribonuclease E/G n=1 Tax=Amaricoccus sp. TaxID=1872485 RepID=UPI001B7685BB|nr:ribonuclease E/G [Amaricoccus sp.]MBP7000399.1 ribonuclease E/G [Amaricoccus sp.]